MQIDIDKILSNLRKTVHHYRSTQSPSVRVAIRINNSERYLINITTEEYPSVRSFIEYLSDLFMLDNISEDEDQ